MTDTVIETNTQIAPQSPKRARWIATGVAVVVVLGGVAWAFSRPSNTSVIIPPADMYTVRTLSQAANITTTGTVASNAQVSLAFQNVGGTITTLNAHVGEHVHAGQVLAVLNNAALQAQVQQAQAGVAQATGQLAQAKGGLAQANAQYRVVTQGATPQNVAVVAAAVNSAKTALANAQKQYQTQLASYNDRTLQKQQLVAAQNAVAQAKTAYETAQQTQTTATQNQQSAISAAQSALATAQNNLKIDQQNLATDQQQYGNITLAQVQKEYATYQSALSNYNSWQNGAYAGINPYASAMQSDQTVYQSDSQGYYALQGTQQKVKADESAITSAQNELIAAQNSLTTVQSAVSQAQTAYANAQSAEQIAEQAYNDRTQQQQALTAAANAVKQQQTAVLQAESQLQQVKQPTTAAAVNAANMAIQSATAGVQTATAGVQAANAALHTAQVNEGYSILRAPVNGTVTQKISSVGDMIAPGQPVLEMDVPQLQVDLAVSDTQLPFVKVGLPIRMTVSALPGRVFTGSIYEVDPTPITGNGTEYQVKATLQDRSNTLQPGMSGSVTINTSSHTGTELAIPAMALQQVNGVAGVYVLGNNPTTASTATGSSQASSMLNANLPKNSYFQPVQVGYQGTQYVEITGGLKNGQQVLLGVGRFISTSASTN